MLAGIIGLPAALAASLGVSRLTPAPGRSASQSCRVRVPGGETLFTGSSRLLRLRTAARPKDVEIAAVTA